MDRARTGWIPRRALTVALCLFLVAALCLGAVAIGAGAQGEPPEKLTDKELLSRLTAAPENAPDFRATVIAEQTLVPGGVLGASEGGDIGGDSGPRTARVWRGGPDRLRAELQGENGDRVLVRNGDQVSVYDGTSNTLKIGEKPEAALPGAAAPDGLPGASPENIDELLAEIAPSSKLTTGEPVEVAGRWAYPLTLEPKDKSATLVERAKTLVDAEAFVPLLLELYAEGNPEPVVRYEAQDFHVGLVPDARFEVETPPGATVERPEPQDDRADEYREDDEPRAAASVKEASELAGFTVDELPEPPRGRELEEIMVAADGVVLTYGSDWGAMVLAEKARDKEGTGPSRDAGAGGRGGRLQMAAVDLGDGVQARELSTPVGTVLSWSDGGITYTLAGSVPASGLREAARGLLAR
jgi:outer membrane lipoprotein-sorting protein